MLKSSAIAHSNIALVKYWGRSRHHDPNLNIPLNDTVSMTKYGMSDDIHLQTHTTIEFSPEFNDDKVSVRGHEVAGRNLERIIYVIDNLRSSAKIDYRFKMMSQNDFPTQAGLASSASAFAALTLAAADALGLKFSRENLSKIARLGSGSAARSIHGGFVYCYGGNSHDTSYAEQICTVDCFDMHAVIAVVDAGKKEITSDEGHHLAHTSPFNEFRIEKSHQQAHELRKLILENDFNAVG
ncbi:MAG TPA: diphosphomevalonate decarboxylase, partial [bacterium]